MELWAIKCPQCGAIWLPPEIVCAKCKIEIEDKEENWVKLGNKGTLLHAYHVTGAREVDPSTGWQSAGQVTGPIGFIRPDGGNEWTLHCHALDAENLENIQPGMRVEAVWRPTHKRTGTIQDIRFWRIIDE